MKSIIFFLVLFALAAAAFAQSNEGKINLLQWAIISVHFYHTYLNFLDCNIKHFVSADEIQKAFGTEWQFKANRYCDKRQILKKLRFSSLKKAKKECAGNPECTMVVGVNCEKSKMFNLCKGVSRSISPKLGSCAYYNLQRYDADDLTIWVRYQYQKIDYLRLNNHII